jgi:hypothetical protein
MPNVEHGTTLADLSRCHASRYALSQFSENGFSGHYGEVAENPGGLNGSMQHYLIWRWC